MYEKRLILNYILSVILIILTVVWLSFVVFLAYQTIQSPTPTPTNQCMIEQWYCIPLTSTNVYKIQIEEE